MWLNIDSLFAEYISQEIIWWWVACGWWCNYLVANLFDKKIGDMVGPVAWILVNN